MARRPRRSLAALLVAIAVAGCAAAGAVDAGPASVTGATTSSPPTSTATSLADTTTSSLSPSEEPIEADAEVVVPEGEGPFPAVVLVHGGGWVAGGPSIMDPLADHLNANGYLTVNTRYALASLDHAAYPEAVEDVACAVRFAASHPDSDGTVAVVGHSAGAHIGALVALTGDQYQGDCEFPGPGLPDRFIGLAGPYDVSRLGLAVAAFFGGGPESIPEVWEAGNPLLHTNGNGDLDSLIMYGERDGLVPDTFAFDFHQALVDSGSDSLLELVEGAMHNEMHDPALVGDLIVTWLGR
jgi:dienelactone hydrolase